MAWELKGLFWVIICTALSFGLCYSLGQWYNYTQAKTPVIVVTAPVTPQSPATSEATTPVIVAPAVLPQVKTPAEIKVAPVAPVVKPVNSDNNLPQVTPVAPAVMPKPADAPDSTSAIAVEQSKAETPAVKNPIPAVDPAKTPANSAAIEAAPQVKIPLEILEKAPQDAPIVPVNSTVTSEAKPVNLAIAKPKFFTVKCNTTDQADLQKIAALLLQRLLALAGVRDDLAQIQVKSGAGADLLQVFLPGALSAPSDWVDMVAVQGIFGLQALDASGQPQAPVLRFSKYQKLSENNPDVAIISRNIDDPDYLVAIYPKMRQDIVDYIEPFGDADYAVYLDKVRIGTIGANDLVAQAQLKSGEVRFKRDFEPEFGELILTCLTQPLPVAVKQLTALQTQVPAK